VISYSVQIKAPENKAGSAFLRYQSAMLDPMRVSPSWLDVRFSADLANQNILVLVEEWELRAEFDQQLNAAKLEGIVATVEFCNAAPVIHMEEITRKEGIDALALCAKSWCRGSLASDCVEEPIQLAPTKSS
jgi:quinol monooxygenase YgiN